jgi:hypothetical protein
VCCQDDPRRAHEDRCVSVVPDGTPLIGHNFPPVKLAGYFRSVSARRSAGVVTFTGKHKNRSLPEAAEEKFLSEEKGARSVVAQDDMP